MPSLGTFINIKMFVWNEFTTQVAGQCLGPYPRPVQITSAGRVGRFSLPRWANGSVLDSAWGRSRQELRRAHHGFRLGKVLLAVKLANFLFL